MKAYVVDVRNNQTYTKDSDWKLDELCRTIRCEYIGIVRRSVEGHMFNIVIDDLGMLRKHVKYGAVERFGQTSGKPALAGTIVVLGVDEDTLDLRGLTDDEEQLIDDNIFWLYMGGPKYDYNCLRLDQCKASTLQKSAII